MITFAAHGQARFLLHTPLVYGVDLEGPFNTEFFIELCQKVDDLLATSSRIVHAVHIHLRFNQSALMCKDSEHYFLAWLENVAAHLPQHLHVTVTPQKGVEGLCYLTELVEKISVLSDTEVVMTACWESALAWHRFKSMGASGDWPAGQAEAVINQFK